MVQKLMEDNLINKDPTFLSKKNKQEDKIDEKLIDILIEQLEKSQIKRKFEKMTSILGITTRQYLAGLRFEEFYKSRKNLGVE